MTSATLAALLALAAAQDDAPKWTDDVRPILAEHCFACHGPDDAAREAGVRLDTADGLAGKGRHVSVLEAGDSEGSELLYRVETDDEFERMPPPDVGPGLTAEEVDVLRRWIDAGAQWEPHWAYAPFRDVEVDVDAEEAIDAFIDRALEREGVAPSAPATPHELIHRVALDLTGLPPEAALVDRFLADPSVEHYARIVDELLATTAHAEHQARRWLDLARYADSHGFTIDGGRTIWPWRDQVVGAIARDQPYDRFTIEQLAGDLLPNATRDQRIATGFHRNTQINQEGGAGDEENRISAVIDRVATTGTVWLGSSIGCAQCHTHKFDPITQTEYFGLYAFFNSTADGGVTTGPTLLAPRNERDGAMADAWESRGEELRLALRAARDRASAGFTTWRPARTIASNGPELRADVDGSFRVFGQNPVFSTYDLSGPAEVERVRTLRLEVRPEGGPGRGPKGNFVLQRLIVSVRESADAEWTPIDIVEARASFSQEGPPKTMNAYPVESLVTGADGPGWAIGRRFHEPHVAEFTLARDVDLSKGDLRVEMVQEFGSRHTIGSFRLLLGAEPSAPDRELVTDEWRQAWSDVVQQRKEIPSVPSTLVMREREEPRVTRRFERGSFLDQREPVEPGFPVALDHFSPRDDSPPRTRLDLARWLAHPENALVHRVTVNRWWQQIFGTGLVATENDFGLRGARPTHPELLEWLAADFVEHGFSRRHVLRRLVMSNAYRRSTVAAPGARERDASNRWLGRMTRRRLSGEELRDRMLASAGILDRTVGGPPVQPLQPDGVYAFTQSAKKWLKSKEPDRFRRSLYVRIWRSAPYPFFVTFDAPAPSVACTRRTTSRTPLQALALANDPMVMEVCGKMADALVALDVEGDEPRVRAAFRMALGRAPSDAETARLVEYAVAVRAKKDERSAWVAVSRVLFNLDEFSHRP